MMLQQLMAGFRMYLPGGGGGEVEGSCVPEKGIEQRHTVVAESETVY